MKAWGADIHSKPTQLSYCLISHTQDHKLAAQTVQANQVTKDSMQVSMGRWMPGLVLFFPPTPILVKICKLQTVKPIHK